MSEEELLLCKEKIKYGDPESIIKLANYYLEMGYEDKAFLTISRFQYLSSSEGYKKLGYFYEKGIGTKVDLDLAMKYYLRAYEMGDFSAGYNIALLLIKEERYEEGIIYLCNGKMNNHIPSIRLLAKLYTEGLGVNKNIEIAINLYLLLIDLGDMTCYDKIGKIYYQNGDYQKAVEYFQIGVDKMDYNAMYHLAICYAKGQGVPQNIAKAIYYYEIGANNNHLGCIYNLAVHYEKGIGVKQDLEKSKQLFQKHAKLKTQKEF